MRILQEDIGAMKILHLVHRSWPYHGGAERYVLEHALAGERWGHSSVICTTDAWDMSWLVSRSGSSIVRREDLYNGVEIKRFPVIHPPFQNILRATLRRLSRCGPDRYYYPNPFIPSLHRWLSVDRGFDFVHANAMPFMLYEGWRYSRKHGTGLASVPLPNVGEKYRRISPLYYFDGCQEDILRNSSFVVAQSSFEKKIYADMGLYPERILQLGCGIDPAEFVNADPESVMKRFGIEKPLVLSLTAHCRERGTEHILAACRNLWMKGYKFTLLLAGPVLPEVEEYFADTSESIGKFDDNIVLTDYVSNRDRIDLLAASDILLQPSRLDSFGIVLLEAWMSGKPVIGCWSGAMPDIISDGINGFLVSWGDTATLSNRIRILLDNPELGLSMGEKGRKSVLERWTWDKVTDKFYRRLSQCTTMGNSV